MMGHIGAATRNFSGAETFVQSELFAKTFREGMALVEDTANYLDGDGREASKTLSRDLALTYAGSSMRLTTQLMQIASWLLVLRAVREGEMAIEEAREAKYRIENFSQSETRATTADLPERLVALIDATHTLYSRISRLDCDLFGDSRDEGPSNDAVSQQQALIRAFKG